MSRRKIAIVSGIALLATAAAGAVAFGARDRFGGDDDMMGGRGHGWHHGRHHGGFGDGMMGGGFRMGRNITKEDFDTRMRERFARLDKNSDGVIDRSEIEAMQASRMEKHGRRMEKGMDRMLRRLGADASGKVTREAFIDRVKKNFAQMDLDGDGRITDADLPPMMRGRGVLDGKSDGGHPGRGMRHGNRGGGHVMGMVREAAAKVGGNPKLDDVLAIAEGRFKQFDRNGDGVVDKADGVELAKQTATYHTDRFLHRYGARQVGKITREQFEKVANERFAMRDVDGDGEIERGERGGRHGWHGGGRGEGRERGHGSEHGRDNHQGPDGARKGDQPRQN